MSPAPRSSVFTSPIGCLVFVVAILAVWTAMLVGPVLFFKHLRQDATAPAAKAEAR